MRPDVEKILRVAFQILRSGIVGCVALCVCLPSVARPDNWQARIYEPGAPSHLVGVDKRKRTFNFFEKKSPLSLKYSYPCVTGQLQGDKQQINDLRTPEGIYFVEYKIANGLDFREYGGVAYTLNYPNPVDRLRGKTGHGIWIHSKGFELVPTRGCVAIDLRNITEIGPMLTPGTPVVLAEELQGIENDNATLATLRALMAEWSGAWESRSDKLFSYYDPDAYSRATENFTAFRQNKERLFKMLSFIKIYNREIHALEGPGYWVTWSEQFYTASNLSTEGIRRLYWQKDKAGNFRIVGMEWTPRDVGMRADFQKGRLVAQAPSRVAADTSSELPHAPRLDMPEIGAEAGRLLPPVQDRTEPQQSYLGRISAGVTASIAALAENLVAISEPLVPKKLPKAEPRDEYEWGIGRKLTEPAPKPVDDSAEQARQPKDTEKTVIVPVDVDTTAAKKPKNAELDENDIGAVRNRVEAWHENYRNRAETIADFYDKALFNRFPATLQAPKRQSLATVLKGIKKDIAQPWIFVITRGAKIEAKGPVAVSSSDEMIITPQGARQGVQKLWWQKNADGIFRIIAADFQPRPLGLEANYLEHITGDISHMVESWRHAWENGDLNTYMAFYTPDASQQGRLGQNNIRRQKELLWSRVKPSQVQLSGLRLLMDARGIRADMNQSYKDSSGHADKGVKTLFLRYDGHKWLIQREDWADSRAQAKLAAPRQP